MYIFENVKEMWSSCLNDNIFGSDKANQHPTVNGFSNAETT